MPKEPNPKYKDATHKEQKHSNNGLKIKIFHGALLVLTVSILEDHSFLIQLLISMLVLLVVQIKKKLEPCVSMKKLNLVQAWDSMIAEVLLVQLIQNNALKLLEI